MKRPGARLIGTAKDITDTVEAHNSLRESGRRYRMLKEVAERLSHCVSDDDTVVRMGGDEFTLPLPGREDREKALKQAIMVAEQILSSLARPFPPGRPRALRHRHHRHGPQPEPDGDRRGRGEPRAAGVPARAWLRRGTGLPSGRPVPADQFTALFASNALFLLG